MGLFDKIKDTANTITDKAKEVTGNAMASYNEKKEQEKARKAEMAALAEAKKQEIISAIMAYENDGSFYKNTSKDELVAFSKNFFDKIVLPASSVSNTKIKMIPYIDDKLIGKIKAKYEGIEADETIILVLSAEDKQEIVLTDRALCFSLAIPEDAKFFATGRVGIENISMLSTGYVDGKCVFKCDEYELASFTADKVTLEDFASLNNYFKCIAEHDFNITDEEVDQLIRQKIGDKVLAEVKKYMVYDDESFVYFAWGINSLTAKDYIVCTNKQIILVDREVAGMTENVRQFYYEDITSVNVLQNTKSGDWTVDLIANAITSATKTCDMVITVAGSNIRVSNLFKIEAERVAAVYHEMKKQSKLAASKPQVVQAQPVTESPIDKLQKLAQLKDAGIISEEEFNQKKVELMSQI